MPELNEILIVSYIREGMTDSTANELLRAARDLSDQVPMIVSLAILGTDDDALAKIAISAGADKVYLLNDPQLNQYQSDIFVHCMSEICTMINPSIVLIARNAEGRELAPRLAFRLRTGLAQDCLEVAMDESTNRLLANRPVYGGSAIAVVACNADPQIAAIRPKAYEPLDFDESRTGEIIKVEISIPQDLVKTKILDRVSEESEGVQLEDARIVIAGGRGLGGPEPFEQLGELANILDGAVGASRAAVDSGWVPHSFQVGLTGKTITPDVYITVAISGASQHMAGCSGSKVIVAINKDPEANIFIDAKYGIVGDWENILPALTETIRELTDS
jgi:electron transfer flavoprotein alpha subunit